MKSLDSRYKCPSRTTFSERIIPKMYVSCKAEVKNQLANADQVALTTDGWTSCANDSYITVTSSHINDQWELVNFVLQTRILNESHTADNLADVIKEAVQEWGISCHNGFPPVTTDNAANVTKSVKLTDSTLHVPCLAHTINLAVQKSLKVKRVANILGKIRRIAAFFHRSPTANELLKQKALLLSLPSHDLIIDVVTRWNSAFDMMARFLEMQCAVITVLISKEMPKGKDLSALTEEEMRITEDIIQLLKPMKDMTTMLCTEDSPTLSVIMPLMHHMKLTLSAKDDDVPAVREMKAIMLADLQDRYNDQRETLLVASAVDPRFKHLPFLSDAERYDVYKNLTLKTSEVMESRVHRVKSEPNTEENAVPALPELNLPEIESQAVVSDAPHDDDVSPSTADCVQDVKPTTLLEGILGDVFLVKYEPAKSPFEMSKLEIDSYVSHSGITLNQSCLQWWKRNEETFPNLSKLAKKLLCIPATSVPSERAFSTAGDIVTHQRASLKAKNVDMLLFLKKNLKD